MRLMILSTYPASAEASGGVARLSAMRDAVARAGLSPTVVAVVPEGRRSISSRECVIPLPADALSRADWAAPGFHDVATGLAAARTPQVIDALIAIVDQMQPDAFMLEQPYLVDLALKVLAARPALRLVYSAANIEAPLKRELARLTPQHYGHPDDLAAEADRMERLAISRAVLVIAISAADAQDIKARGGAEIVLAGNGSVIADEELAVQSPDPRSPVRYGCLGSGYWPNVEGLAAVVAPSLAFLPPGHRLETIGRIGEKLICHPAWRRGRAINEARLHDAGFVAGDRLGRFLAAMDALILPVFVGGGSMLKTADVLAAGRPALLSRRAAVGYEDVIAASDGLVSVADSPEEFRKAWIALTSQPRDRFWAISADREALRRNLSWEQRLALVGPALESVLRGERPRDGLNPPPQAALA
jgi:NAD(P)H-hydrate repair Nnr-like enzyme with NAD(P)H-hydrate dehydratase domain